MNKIAIVLPNVDTYSETFIQNHIKHLPAEITLLYGSLYRPKYYGKGEHISQYKFTDRLINFMRRKFLHISMEQICDEDIARLLKLKSIQLVLAEYGTNAVGMMRPCALAKVPLIAHFRGFDAYSNNTLNAAGKQYKELFKMVSAVIAVSQAMVNKLIYLGADPEKVHCIPSGVDINLFKTTDPSQTPPVFISVGRFVEKKAPDLTLFAFRKVFDVIPDARLIMIGDGPLWGVCQRLAKSLDIENHVSFLGVCSHEEVAEQMHNMRAFVQHSITALSGDIEGTPNSLKEAHASGLPVVSTRIGGIPEIVLEGQTGFLVDEGDIDGMAQAMIKLGKDPNLAMKMGKAGRKLVEERFSMDKSINSLWRIIQSAIQK